MQRQQAAVLEHPQGGSGIGDHDCCWGCCGKFERASGDGGFDAEAEVSWFPDVWVMIGADGVIRG